MKTTYWPESGPRRNWSGRLRVRGAMLQVAWLELLGDIQWDLFVTLTFDPNRVYPVGAARAGKEAFKWCGLAGWAFRRPVGWLIAPERGASGSWHAHVLLVDVPTDVSALAAIWQSRNGQIDVQQVKKAPGVILYATKEAALSGEIVLSDTLASHRQERVDRPRVGLYPHSEGDAFTREPGGGTEAAR